MNPLIKLVVTLVIIILFPTLLKASVDNYLNPFRSIPSYSDYGTLGLIQMPNARMRQAGSLGFAWSKNDPYMRGGIVVYPFSFFEAQYKYTDINDLLYSNSKRFSGGQSLKDKGFDFKIQLLKETHSRPAIAIGFKDFAGTNRFQSEFIVASKYFGNFDATIGLSWGVMNDGIEIKNPLISIFGDSFSSRIFQGGKGGTFSTEQWFRGKEASLFGGIEYTIPWTRGHRIKIELDANNYTDPSKILEGRRAIKQDSNFNIGYVYPVSQNLFLSTSIIRGNTLQFGFSFVNNFGIKKTSTNSKPKPLLVKNEKEYQEVNAISDKNLYLTTLKLLNERGTFLQSADIKDDTFKVVYAQNSFNSYPRASGRVLRVLNSISPDKITKFSVSNLNADFIANTINIQRSQYQQALEFEDFQQLKNHITITQESTKFGKLDFVPKAKFPLIDYAISPSLRSHIGGPDGFVLGQVWLRGDLRLTLNRNWNISAIAGIGIYDTFDQLKLKSDSVLPRVRTEIVTYLKGLRDYNISRLQINYVTKMSKNSYARFSAGLFEEMFSGIGGELLYRPFSSNFAFGLEAYQAYKRAYDGMFDTLDYDIVTGHATFYYNEPRTNILLKLTGGRFLARDSGITLDLSRRLPSGMHVGAFITRTDVSAEEFGEGSFDKGFYFSLPIDLFFNSYSKERTSFGLRPLTRDGGAKLISGSSLYGITDMSTRYSIIRDMDDIFD